MLYSINNNHIKLDIDNHGAEANSLVADGINVLRKKDEVWGRTAPILFPIVGCLKDNYTIINGIKYPLTKHGFLRDHDLEVIKHSKSKIIFKDKYSESSLKLFPFKYEAYVTYEIINNAVRTTISIKNIDDVTFKYNIGGHPGFNCPLFDKDNFEDYVIRFSEAESFATPNYVDGMWDFNNPEFTFYNINEIKLDYKYFYNDAFVIKDIKSRTVYLLNKDNKGIKFSFSGFNTLAFWTKGNAKYLCLEPWVGYDDLVDSNHQFDTKDDLIEIKPGEEKEVSYEIELIE